MKTIAFIAAVAVATVAVSAASTPAFAKQPHGSFGAAKVSYDSKTDRYCFRETVTGSRIPVTQCRSRSQWAQAGLTITRKAAVQLAQR